MKENSTEDFPTRRDALLSYCGVQPASEELYGTRSIMVLLHSYGDALFLCRTVDKIAYSISARLSISLFDPRWLLSQVEVTGTPPPAPPE